MPLCGAITKRRNPCIKTVKNGKQCFHHKDVCPCCFEPMRQDETEKNLACKHHIHYACLWAWSVAQRTSNKTCPMCRGPLTPFYQWPKSLRTGCLVWSIDNVEDASMFKNMLSGYAPGLFYLGQTFNSVCTQIATDPSLGPNDEMRFVFELSDTKKVKTTLLRSSFPGVSFYDELCVLMRLL